MSDSELQAMGAVAAALDQLDEPTRTRVLRWAAERFGAEAAIQASPQSESDIQRGGQASYEEVGDLVHAAGPSTGLDYALAVAYWIQVIEGKSTWAGLDVNNILKDLGHGLSNVTKTLKSLMNRKPALVMQTSKAGRSRQARKSYKLTAAGISQVQAMLSGGGGPDEA